MIIHITGPAKSGKSLIANALRNSQIGQAKGALLVDEAQDGEPRYLLEKVIAGEPLPADPIDADKVPWKQDAVVVVVGKQIDMLDEFEALVPGFTKALGPVVTLTTSVAKSK